MVMDGNNNIGELINEQDALARIGGNLTLYKRLLGRFTEGNHLELLENALGGGDREDALRQTHTLKGVSANLSLVKVTALSAELEQLLKNNADYSACLSELKQAFDATIGRINELTTG